MRSALLVSLALVALTPSASAADWSEPAVIPGATDAFPLAAMTAGGEGLAIWPDATAFAALSTPSSSASALRDDGTFTPARPVGPLGVTHAVTYSEHRFLVAGESRRDGRRTAAFAFGRPDGTFGAVRSFGLTRFDSRVQDLEAAPNGAAAMTVSACETSRCGTRSLFAVIRRAGGQFSKTVRLARAERLGDSAVAVNTRGDVLVTWERARWVYARVRRADGRLGPLQRLGRGVQASLGAEIGQRREAIVAWGHQRVSSGVAHSSFFANVAFRPAGSHRARFRTPRQLGEVPVRGSGRYVARPGVATALEGDRATVAYVTYAGGRYLVQSRDLVKGRLQRPATVSPPGADAILADLATARGGAQLVLTITGRRGSDPAGPVQLWATPRGGAPERIAGGELIDTAAAGLGPSGRAFAVWRAVSAPITASVRTP